MSTISRRRFRQGLVASLLIGGLLPLGGTLRPAPSIFQQCADRLGIEWSAEDGATEQLNAFSLCVTMFTPHNTKGL